MNIPRKIGDQHVVDVSSALNKFLTSGQIDDYRDTTKKTVEFIVQLYPNIKEVQNKFETGNPDFNPDLCLVLLGEEVIKINLFYIKGKAAVQPKNLGAQSFLEKYFLSEELQFQFNNYFRYEYSRFIKLVVGKKDKKTTYDNIQEMKKKVKNYYPKFTVEIEPIRQDFLFNLREFCFHLLKNEFNKERPGIKNAFRELLMMDNTNIITRYNEKNKCLYVEEFKSNPNFEENIKIYKKGNNSFGIRCGEQSLLLRFKFESSPTSSIKLATSFERFPTENTRLQFNKSSILKFEDTIINHINVESKNISNAVGKCNEAMVYYQILKNKPEINQVEPQEFQFLLENYSPIVAHEDLLAIQEASKTTVYKLDQYLDEKYDHFTIDSIQLVPNNYLKDRLDTSDLKLILMVDNKYFEEAISLKALAKRTNKITAKNPGVGQILGDQYFGIGSLSQFVNEVKERFLQEEIDHKQSLIEVSYVLGKKLNEASQENLRKGITSLLGSSILVITFYRQNECFVLEHCSMKSEIEVLLQHPSPIQTTLSWNKKQEELSLRVKFSAGQEKGWSSLKLACEFKVNIE